MSATESENIKSETELYVLNPAMAMKENDRRLSSATTVAPSSRDKMVRGAAISALPKRKDAQIHAIWGGRFEGRVHRTGSRRQALRAGGIGHFAAPLASG